jgi:GxxExxY protein
VEQNYLYADLTEQIIGAAMEVHRNLGAGFLESVYEESLAIEFELRKIKYERQKPVNVMYKGRAAKQFVCDFIIEGKVLVELKALKQLTSTEMAQTLNYLKATDLKIGLLINFGQPSLKCKRLAN